MFRRVTDIVPLWAILFEKQGQVLHGLPQYKDALEIVRQDPVIGPQLDSLVGSAMGGAKLPLTAVIDGILIDLLQSGAATFEEAEFETRYRVLESALLSVTIPYVMVAPFSAFSCGSEIDLGNGWTIGRLTEAERALVISAGMVRSPFGDEHFMFHVPSHGIRYRFELPKLVGTDRPPEADGQITKLYQDIEGTLEKVVHALRLFKAGNVFLLGRLMKSKNELLIAGTSWSIYATAAPFSDPTFTLDADEAGDWSALWRGLQSDGVVKTKYLDVSIRRFSYKSERSRPEDQVVDLAIAAEALFLTEGEAETRGEQAYRLAMRAAYFIESPRWSRRQLNKLMRTAYRIRNAVVHGGSPPKVTLPDGSEVHLSAFIEVFEDELRRAIRKSVEMASHQRGRSLAIDWEAMIFAEPRMPSPAS